MRNRKNENTLKNLRHISQNAFATFFNLSQKIRELQTTQNHAEKRKTETEVSACSFSYSLAHYAVNVIVIVALVFETLSM